MSRLLVITLCFFVTTLVKAQDTAAYPEVKTANVDFTDHTDIRRLLLDVAKQFEIQVIIPESLEGTEGIKLREVTWRDVFRAVLAPRGYDFIERDKVVEIMTREEAARLPAEIRNVEVFFQQPNDLVVYLTNTFGEKVKAQAVGDVVKFSSHPRHTQMVLRAIAYMDSPAVRLVRFPRKLYFPATVPNLPLPELPYWTDEKETTTEVINLRWVDCGAVKQYLDGVYPKLSMTKADYRSNVVIVTDTPLGIRKALALATYLDDKRWYQRPGSPLEPSTAKTSTGAAPNAQP